MKAAQLAILIVLVTMLGWSKLRPLLLIAFAVIAAGIVFQVLGDYQVAHSIWRTTGNPGRGSATPRVMTGPGSVTSSSWLAAWRSPSPRASPGGFPHGWR